MVWIVVGAVLALLGAAVIGMLGWRLWRKTTILAATMGRAAEALGELPPRPNA